jgi:2-iminobutanoate/2-iminopropanoate deaminase
MCSALRKKKQGGISNLAGRRKFMRFWYPLSAIFICLLVVGLVGCAEQQQSVQNKEVTSMQRRIINPWTWQDKFGFVQSNEVTGANRMLFTAGIVSVDGEGNLLHPDDMEKQIEQIIDNLELLLEQADFQLSDVVRFTYFTTDIPAFTKAAKSRLIERLGQAGCKPATSLIGIQSLFHPNCVVEIEATVIK